VITKQERSPSLPALLGEKPTDPPTQKQKSPTQLEPVEDTQAPSEQAPQDKGKDKEQPDKGDKEQGKGGKEQPDKGDINIKMQDSSPSPPRQPRGAPSSAPFRRMSRSPPRGPRTHLKTPTAPASFYAPAKDWPRRNNTMSVASIPPAIPAEIDMSGPEPPALPIATLPMIPFYQAKPSITPEIDAEIARVQAHRAHLASDYVQVAKATRRALHELDLAAIDLRAAENRRKVADSQVEKARAGVLGIDAHVNQLTDK